MNAIDIASAGLASAGVRFDASARRTVAGGDLAAEAVTQISTRNEFAADVSVLKTADAMLGTLLDIKV